MTCLNQCCCCCSLRTGGLVIGWLGTVDAIIKGIGAIVFCVLLYTDEEHFSSLSDSERFELVAFSLIVVVVALIISILLLVGSQKKKHQYLLPWLITNGLAGFGGFVAVLIVGGIFLSHSDVSGVGGLVAVTIGIITYCIGIPLSCLTIYFWICIFSLYQSMRNEYSITQVIYSTPKV